MGKNEMVERREPNSNWITERSTAVVRTWETEGGIGTSLSFVYTQYIKLNQPWNTVIIQIEWMTLQFFIDKL